MCTPWWRRGKRSSSPQIWEAALRYLIVDGMMSGTGLRDALEGGYIEPRSLGLGEELLRRLEAWLSRYEAAHYGGFEDHEVTTALDREGVQIAQEIKCELEDVKVRYFSAALLKYAEL